MNLVIIIISVVTNGFFKLVTISSSTNLSFQKCIVIFGIFALIKVRKELGLKMLRI